MMISMMWFALKFLWVNYLEWTYDKQTEYKVKPKRNLDTYSATINQRRIRKAQRIAGLADTKFAFA